ncbi:MAG: FAD-binding oxidoreductase [Acetobacter sp.]|uniref:NAD(P)/FAD-dependent oxidoreductase n=1 Tax=Acetobacter sp. TaxID=440 RepID=UPI0039E9DFD8
MTNNTFEVVVVGAGNIGIAVAYYLVRHHGVRSVALVDSYPPMSVTSAQSGENYRNWWPHPVMTAYTDDSIDLMEKIAAETDDRIAMTRRGYALVTRQADPVDLIKSLYHGYGKNAHDLIRIHDRNGLKRSYQPPLSADWKSAPDGVDVLCDPALIRHTFPNYAPDVASVLHIRRAGSISGQQLGQFMLEHIRSAGGEVIRAELTGIEAISPFTLRLKKEDGPSVIHAPYLVNAAGPFVRDVAQFLGEDLPVSNVYQQKIAFEDRDGAIPRDQPFTIDLDGQYLAWTQEEREIMEADPECARFLAAMPGGIHCRPDGAENGKWIKLGWAYNTAASDPHAPAPKDEQFPDIVLRAASRLQPRLHAYIGRLPRGTHHYGGYYSKTEENWPLIGPMKTSGAFVAGAMSGFGTMAACISGSLCASWVCGGNLPPYAHSLSLARYEDSLLMEQLLHQKDRGVL